MAVGLTVTSVAIWWAASRVLHAQLDQGITAAAFLVANELSQSPECSAVVHPLALDAIRYQREINRFVVWRDPHCAAVRAVPGWAMDLPADSAAIAAAREGTRSFSDARWHGKQIRSTYVAVRADTGPSEVIVQVGASLEPIRELQRLVLGLLAGLVLVGTGATFAGAWRMAGSAVKPVLEITEQAAHIEAGTLDQRLAAHATVDEYRGLVGVLNRMLDRLASAFAAQRRFTADVSHELRTPLTALRGEIEVALRAERSQREYLRVLHSALEEIDRMTTMTEELLLISRAEARLITPRREPTEVGALVAAALERLRHRIEDKELVVDHAKAWNGAALLDAELTARLVDELLDNAVTYTEVGGRIIVRQERTADRLRLVVEDTGPGIPPEDLPHIFDAYYRADAARTRGAGTGLGLTAVAAIARLHGGEVRAANRPQGGARFEVELPVPPS
jgi:two-component system OmpR family sensor kinase